MDPQTPTSPSSTPLSPPSPPASPSRAPSADVEKNKGFAAVSYLWIASLIVLLLKKDSPFVQFHAKQGFILFLASIIVGFIPVLNMVLSFVIFVFVVVGIVSALQGHWRKLPGISILAEKVNF